MTPRPSWLMGLLLLGGMVGCALVLRSIVPMTRADYLSSLASSEGAQALKVGGTQGGDLMRGALTRYESARLEAGGIRRGRIAAAEARLLEGLMERMSASEAGGSGVRENAIRRALDAVEANRLDPYLWHDLSRIMMTAAQRAQDPRHAQELENQAIDAARQGCALDPFNVALEADLARRLALTHRNDESDAAFRRSLQAAPQQIEVRIDHARVLRAAGRADEATAELQEVVRQDPGNAVATKMLHDQEQGGQVRRPRRAIFVRMARRAESHGGH